MHLVNEYNCMEDDKIDVHFPTDKHPCSNLRRPKPTEDADRRIGLKDLIQKYNIQPKALDEELTDEKLSDIAHRVDFDWKRCARKLGVSSTDINDIGKDYHEVKEQRYGALQKWKQKKSFMATGKALVEMLLNIDEAKHAKEVCLSLK